MILAYHHCSVRSVLCHSFALTRCSSHMRYHMLLGFWLLLHRWLLPPLSMLMLLLLLLLLFRRVIFFRLCTFVTSHPTDEMRCEEAVDGHPVVWLVALLFVSCSVFRSPGCTCTFANKDMEGLLVGSEFFLARVLCLGSGVTPRWGGLIFFLCSHGRYIWIGWQSDGIQVGDNVHGEEELVATGCPGQIAWWIDSKDTRNERNNRFDGAMVTKNTDESCKLWTIFE